MLIAVDERIVHDYLRTLHVKTKCHFLDAFFRQGFVNGMPIDRVAVEKKKTASSRARDLTADRLRAPGLERIADRYAG